MPIVCRTSRRAAAERGEVGGRLHDDAEHEKQDAERATPEVAARARVDLKRPPEWQMSWDAIDLGSDEPCDRWRGRPVPGSSRTGGGSESFCELDLVSTPLVAVGLRLFGANPAHALVERGP